MHLQPDRAARAAFPVEPKLKHLRELKHLRAVRKLRRGE